MSEWLRDLTKSNETKEDIKVKDEENENIVKLTEKKTTVKKDLPIEKEPKKKVSEKKVIAEGFVSVEGLKDIIDKQRKELDQLSNTVRELLNISSSDIFVIKTTKKDWRKVTIHAFRLFSSLYEFITKRVKRNPGRNKDLKALIEFFEIDEEDLKIGDERESNLGEIDLDV